MDSSAGIVALAIGLFVTTNVDDLFLLIGYFANPKFRTAQIVSGQFIGIGLLFGASVLASLIGLVVGPAWLGLLGLLPIAIGIKQAWALRKPGDEPEEEKPARTAPLGIVAAVTMVTVANGADNLSIYVPLFALRPTRDLVAIGMVFAAMTLAWILIARWLARHPVLGAPLRRQAHRVLPFVLIGLGILVLSEAGTVDLLRNHQ
jgi:cadmium resistance protein CadD (predicted permease)